MQPVTSAFSLEKSREAHEPILLLTLELTGETLYLANREVTIADQIYSELIKAPVEIVLSGEFPPQGGGRPPMGHVEILLANEDDVTGVPFSDKLATRTFPNRKATLRLGFIDANHVALPLADSLPMIQGVLALPEGMLFTDQDFSLEIRDGSDAWHKELGTPITLAAFPNAPEISIGRIQPIIYGSVGKSPCLPIGIGARSTLAAAMTSAATSAEVSDASSFPASGSIWIDEEEIAYTAKSGNSLTGLTRGNPAIPHERGAAVVQKLATYLWRLADHALKAVNAVYIRQRGASKEDWLRVQTADYTVQGATDLAIRFAAGGLASVTPYTERTAWITAVGAGTYFEPNLRLQFTDAQVIPPDTPITLGGGVTVKFNIQTRCFYWGGPAGSWDADYPEVPTAYLDMLGASTALMTFSQAIGAFSMEILPANSNHNLTATATLSDSSVIVDSRVPTHAAHIGWTGGAITSVSLTTSVAPTAGGKIAFYRTRVEAMIGASSPIVKRAVDLAVTTSAGVSTTTASESPSGESFPHTFGGAGQNVNKSYNFLDHPTAIRRKWTIQIGTIVTPAGSTWLYGIGTHLDQFPYPIPPPAVYTFEGEPLATVLIISNSTSGASIQVLAVSCEVVYTGSQAPTSVVSGRNLAHSVYDLEVAADVEGYPDDGSGTYTGIPNSLIIRPADILRHVGVVRLGWTLAERFDAAIFNIARTQEIAQGIRLDFALLEKIHSRDLFEMIREQSMSSHVLGPDGKYRRYLAPFSGDVRAVLTESDDILGPIRCGVTPFGDLRNVIGIRYRPDLHSGDFAGYVEKTDTTSQGTGNPPSPGYATVERLIRDFGLIRDDTTADRVATQWLNWLKDQFFIIEFFVGVEWVHLEPWDHVALNSNRMPGDWSPREFVLLSVRRRLGDPDRPDEILIRARALSP